MHTFSFSRYEFRIVPACTEDESDATKTPMARRTTKGQEFRESRSPNKVSVTDAILREGRRGASRREPLSLSLSFSSVPEPEPCSSTRGDLLSRKLAAVFARLPAVTLKLLFNYHGITEGQWRETGRAPPNSTSLAEILRGKRFVPERSRHLLGRLLMPRP